MTVDKRRKTDLNCDTHKPTPESTARVRWGNKMIEFIGADSQGLVVIVLLLLGVGFLTWDATEKANIHSRQLSASTKLSMDAHNVTQGLLKETIIVMQKGNEEAKRQSVNTIYILSLTAEERKKLRLDVPADYKRYYDR